MKRNCSEFTDARFGVFFHWGLYSVLGGEYKGETMPLIGEWAQSYFRIPNGEYAHLAERFNPVRFDADAWIAGVAEAGAKYIVFTAKHHDGFAMYGTKYNRYNIVDATPFGRDVLAELAAACRKYGVRLGIYYSHALDWSEPDGADPGDSVRKNCGIMSWGNDWDFPERKAKNFDRYFEAKALFQVQELLTNYGPVSQLWFDCPIGVTPEHAGRLSRLISSLQPECLVNSRIGGGFGDYGSLGDNQALCAAIGFPAESPVTMNDTWGYKRSDRNWKSSASLIEKLLGCTETRSNFLLNIGPMPNGAWPPESVRIIKEIGDWTGRYGEMLYASQGNPFPQPLDFAYASLRGNNLFLFLKRPMREAVLNGIASPVRRANVPFRQAGESLSFDVPPETGLIRLEFDAPPLIRRELAPQNGMLRLLPGTGEIRHGEQSGLLVAGEVEVDATTPESSGHSLISRSGCLSQWHNPGDSIGWRVEIPEPAIYRVRLKTVQRGHGAEWRGGRIVGLDIDGRLREAELTADLAEAKSCYESAWSDLGSFPFRSGPVEIRLSTRKLLNPQSVEMELAELRLECRASGNQRNSSNPRSTTEAQKPPNAAGM